jgi:hypothetical protein
MSELKLKWLEIKNAVLDKIDDVKADPRKAIVIAFLAIFLIGVALGANASEVTFHKGQRLTHALSVCLKLEDAQAVASAPSHAKAAEIFMSKPECAEVPVIGPQVGKVVFSSVMEKDGKKTTVRVVEILDKGDVIAYFITAFPVNDKPLKGTDGETIILKPERNA